MGDQENLDLFSLVKSRISFGLDRTRRIIIERAKHSLPRNTAGLIVDIVLLVRNNNAQRRNVFRMVV